MFKTQREDGRSNRTVIVDYAKDKDYGTVLNYRQLGAELNLNPKLERQKIQAAAREAIKTLLKFHKRGLQSVPSIGYRIIQPNEHMIVANSHQSKADKAMIRAVRFYDGTDLSKLTETEAKLHQGQKMLAMAILASHQHLDKRIRRIEDLLSGASTIQAATED